MMKNANLNYLTRRVGLAVFAALCLCTRHAPAQESSLGNATVFGGAEMSFFGHLTFLTGGLRVPPGVILTERASGNLGVVNFVGDGITVSGASNIRHVDGYVRKYGAGRFVFPVGDNGHVGPFAAQASGTMGAYFYVNPSVAITSDVFTGRDYPALPSGGPFAVAARQGHIRAVSNVEYWDIDGASPTTITLTWSAQSNLTTLVNGDLSAVTIVGWNGGKWENIPSQLDVTSVLGSASTLSSGSVTTRAAIIPNKYTAYTLAGLVPDLVPRITVTPNVFRGTNRLEVLVAVLEVGKELGTNGGPITVRVQKNAILTQFEWNPAITVSGNRTSVQNSIWTQSQSDQYYIFTTNTVIPKNSQRRLLFHITLNPGQRAGSFPLDTSIPNDGSGGEVNRINNRDSETIEFFNH